MRPRRRVLGCEVTAARHTAGDPRGVTTFAVDAVGDGNNPSNNPVTAVPEIVTHSVNPANDAGNNPSNNPKLENTPSGGSTSANDGNNPSNNPVTGLGLSFPGPLKGGHDRGNGDKAPEVLEEAPALSPSGAVVVKAWRICPKCGESPCRLELTICSDGRPLVGWTCLTAGCGRVAKTRQGGLWVSFALVAAAGIDMSALPVRIDYRQTDVDPTPLFGDHGADWRVASVRPMAAGVGHGR